MTKKEIARELVKIARSLVTRYTPETLADAAAHMIKRKPNQVCSRKFDSLFEQGNGDEVVDILKRRYDRDITFSKAVHNPRVERCVPPAIWR
jgi:hypothetical protein